MEMIMENLLMFQLRVVGFLAINFMVCFWLEWWADELKVKEECKIHLAVAKFKVDLICGMYKPKIKLSSTVHAFSSSVKNASKALADFGKACHKAQVIS